MTHANTHHHQTHSSSGKKTKTQHQSKGKQRKAPGTTGKGDYYHVILRPKEEFATFRNHDVGNEGHSIRVAGKRSSGSWSTQKWLISKNDAYVDKNSYLRSDREKTQTILKRLGTIPKHTKGDRFTAKPRHTAHHSN
ncbi:MAG: hypothetical protein KIT27_01935 [Legionellales bacterium]|nr:hypothetical protein [Legionellales bacterium]